MPVGLFGVPGGGSVPIHMWVRVRDRDTGHEYDLRDDDPRIGSVVDLVDKRGYPPAEQARPPKYYVRLAARPGPRRKAPQTGSDTKEAHSG